MTDAKRRLSNFNFTGKDAAVALVGPAVGGPANGHTVLVMKSVEDVSASLIQKATQVQVTLDFEDFLQKFMGMYYSDAKLLATILGMQAEDTTAETEIKTYQDYIDEKAAGIKILKSLNKDNLVSNLKATDFVKVLEAQSLLEKAVLQVEKANKEKTGTVPSTNQIDKDKTLEEEIKKAVAAAEEILKSQLTAKEVELVKAKEMIEEMKAKEKAAIEKSRKEALSAVVAAPEVEAVLKSLESLDEAAFAVVLKSFKAGEKASQSNEMFVEKGAKGEGDASIQSDLDKVTSIIKSKKKVK